jgi:hypothetical protein
MNALPFRSLQPSKLGTLRRCMPVLLTAVAVLAMSSGLLRAQVITGDIAGTVTDPTGSVVPGGAITVINAGTQAKRTAVTDGKGEFAFPQLELGVYSVQVSAKGFKSTTITNIALSAGDKLRVTPQLQLGTATETVDVTASAAVLQAESSVVQTTVDQKQTQDLPLNGRNFINLVQNQPGVNPGPPNSMSSGNRPDDRRQSSSVSANGQPETRNNFTIDGLDINDKLTGLVAIRPAIDAIQEINVGTNLYTAEVGRTAGAVVVILTKSGTNNFHGTAYEFFRNDITDARNFFAVASVLPRKPELRQNQFGGSISGPIMKDKLFFFGDYEGLRQVDGTNQVAINTVPTLFEEQNPGNFSDVGGVVLTPGQINATALNYFKLYPKPNLGVAGATANNFVYDQSRIQNTQTFDVRVDRSFNASNLLFARYSFNDANTFTPGQLPPVNGVQAGGILSGQFPGGSQERAHNAQVNFTHIFSPTLLMELKTGYTRLGIFSTPLNYGTNFNDQAAYSIPGANTAPYASGLAPFFLNGYAALGDATFDPIIVHDNTFENAGSVTKTLGNHSLKFGGQLIRRQASYLEPPYPKPRFGFNRGTTAFPGAGASWKNMASMLEGGPSTYQRFAVLVSPSARTWEPAIYVQDDWRAAKKLTLNLGLRYEIFTPLTEKNGNISNFDLGHLKYIVGGSGGVQTQYSMFSPRFGFAYTPIPKTVVRGGAGLSFFPTDNEILLNAPYAYNAGTVPLATIANGVPVPTFASTTTISGGLQTKDLNWKQGYIEQYNLLIEREFGQNIFTVGYVGSLGRRLLESIPNINIPLPNGPYAAGARPAPPAAPYAASLPAVSTIQRYGDQGFSAYNSLQTGVQRRFSKGFSGNANYTWAHGTDDVSDVTIGGNPNAYALQPLNFARSEYSNSDVDVRHRISVLATYEIPSPASGSRLLKLALGGYQINTVTFWQTGLPFTIIDSVPQINVSSAVTADRPNVTGRPFIGGGLSQFFNTAAYTQQPFGTAGNSPRNGLYGPHIRRSDLSLFKTVPVSDRLKLQLRAECFNFTNTPTFGAPNFTIAGTSNVASGATNPDGTVVQQATQAGGFGTITATLLGSPARQFQFAAKIIF